MKMYHPFAQKKITVKKSINVYNGYKKKQQQQMQIKQTSFLVSKGAQK